MINNGVFITEGNSKLLKIPLFSLPPQKTCPQSTELCRKYCYGNKAWRQYSHVRKTRTINYTKSKQKSFIKNISEMIPKLKTKYFRIHETGDYYSQDYLNKWFEIVNAFPNIRFVTFSKSWDLDWSMIPDNMTRFWSIWPDSKNIPKEGNLAYTIYESKEFDYPVNGSIFICPYPHKRCHQCMRCFDDPPKYIAFKKH